MSVTFWKNLIVPVGLSSEITELAAVSIGDTYLAAQQLAADQADALIAAGKAAFSTTHSVLLLTTAAIIAGLAVFVFFLLAGMRKDSVPVDSCADHA